MKTELTKWNIDEALKALEGIKGKDIMVNGMNLFGIVSIDIEASEMLDSDPSINYDGGRRELIDITFKFDNGTASISFCPDEDICHFWNETPDLLCFDIQTIPAYVEKAKFDLDFRLKQYQEHMAK